MAQLLHGSATTTARLRTLLQTSAEPATVLARRYGVNPKTVRKWRRRGSVEDRAMGPRERRSTTLTELEEAAVVAFRVQTRLPLDDVYLALRASIPALTRSTLHRCLQREGVSRIPRAPKQRRGQFASYEIGYFHLDIAEVRTAKEKAYRYVAVDRMCRLLGVEHRLTRPYRPWTDGQAARRLSERMVRTLKDATVRAFHYDSVRELRRHVADYLAAYNLAKHLKALRWRTPVETLEALWPSRPELVRRSPDHLTLGPNTQLSDAERSALGDRSPPACGATSTPSSPPCASHGATVRSQVRSTGSSWSRARCTGVPHFRSSERACATPPEHSRMLIAKGRATLTESCADPAPGVA